jgi:hypothetical protein
MKKLRNFTQLEAKKLLKIAGGYQQSESKDTNWLYCVNSRPCDTTDVISCANTVKPHLIRGCS